MKFLNLFLSISIVLCGNGKGNDVLEWPMFQDGNELYFQLGIGNPVQAINVSLRYFQTNQQLYVLPKSRGGDYDENLSLTWFNANGYVTKKSEKIGKYYWENFKISNRTFYQTLFMMQLIPTDFKASTGFVFHDQEEGLLRNILNQLPSPTVTIAFDEFPKNGTITLGSLDTKLCYKDWKFTKMRVVKNFDADVPRFGFVFDAISGGRRFGRYDNLVFDLNDDSTRWPFEYYDAILRMLGSKDNETFPCNVKETLDFHADNVIISIDPEDYVSKGFPDNKCRLVGFPSDKIDQQDVWLSKSMIFKKYCVSFDEKNKQLGIATRIKADKKVDKKS